jgi:hypothetical protein
VAFPPGGCGEIRTIIALGTVGAAFASTGVASAAVPVHRPGTVIVTRVVPPTKVIDATKVGSAAVRHRAGKERGA